MKLFGLDISVKRESRGTSTFENPAAWFIAALRQYLTTAGINMNPETAMSLITVLCCVDLISRSVASLPLITFERIDANGNAKRDAVDHALYNLLHVSPNEEMTAYNWRAQQMIDVLTRGNAYSRIERRASGEIAALWPIPAIYVTPKRARSSYGQIGRILYDVAIPDQKPITYEAWQMLHTMGLSYDGLVGLSPIALARNGLGLAKAIEDFNAVFFKNGGLAKDVITHPGKMGDKGKEAFKESWNKAHGAPDQARKTAILDEGMDYKVISLPAEDVLFLDARRFTREELASLFHIPPQFVNEMGRATWGNAGVMDIALVKHTLRPWLVNLEQALAWKLLTPTERQRYYFRHNVDALQRGDIERRYTAYRIAHQEGWMNADEIRALEELNPLPDGIGETYLQPLNMVAAGTTPAPPAPPAARGLEVRPLITDVVQRLLRREAADLARAEAKGRRDAAQLDAWRTEYFARNNAHAVWVAETLAPLALASGRDQAPALADRWVEARLRGVPEGELVEWLLGELEGGDDAGTL